MGGIKTFFLGALKIAAGITAAIAALALLGLVVFGIWYGYTASRNAPLAEARTWPEIKIEALEGARLTLVTMWRDGKLHYQFSVAGYPKIVAEARGRPVGLLKRGFTLHFRDKSGFRVFDYHIGLSEMDKIVDATGKGTGLDARDSTRMEPDSYRRADSWTVTWEVWY